MGEIQILPELLINKIAAGEVVERPASVVKELIENSIDSGADQIMITIKNGGKDSISVLDNGKGMSMEDAKLAIERHATSKIKELEDLDKIHTMGFRGEALAAISSVSRFELTTCKDETDGGFQVSIEGGRILQAAKVGFPKGSKIVAENLFFNTPARKKFMKAVRTEYGHIYDIVLKIAMGHPTIQFRLTHNQTLVLNLAKGQNFSDRVRQAFGDEIADDLLVFEHEESYLKFHGLFSVPSSCRPSKRWQHMFVNDRYVKGQSAIHAIYQAYKTILMKNMHPLFFLKIHIDPSELDVNVHPAKREIRFKNQSLIHTILSEQISKKLKQGTRGAFFSHSGSPSNSNTNSLGKEYFDSSKSPPVQELQQSRKKYTVDLDDQIRFSTETTPKQPKSIDAAIQPDKKENPFVFESPQTSSQISLTKQEYLVIGQYRKYILAQYDGRLILIDKHAAHERIRFEMIRKSFYSKTLEIQQLAVPLMLKLTPQDGLLLEQNRESFENLGFVIDHFGGNDYSVKGLPAILTDKDLESVIKDVLDEIATFGKSGKIEIFYNEVFEKMACHSAIRGEQNMTFKEMQSLIDDLENLDLHIHCPHGRPMMIEMSIDELDKKFKRIT